VANSEDFSDSFEEIWQGRVEADEPVGGGRWHQSICPATSLATGGVTLLGFAVDEGVRRNGGRVGAAAGPAAIRHSLRHVARHGDFPLWDGGDVRCPAGDLESAQRILADRVQQVLGRHSFPIVLGGGHEVAWGSFQGLMASAERPKSLLVVNFDAHFDLRQSVQANSGTSFQQILGWCRDHHLPMHYAALGISRYSNTLGMFQRAKQWGATVVLDHDLQAESSLAQATARLDRLLDRFDAVYLSVCLDVLPPGVAPGVSAPAVLGVPLSVIEGLIDHLGGTGKIALADVAEMNPQFDIDGWTARVAARLVARLAEFRSQANFRVLRNQEIDQSDE